MTIEEQHETEARVRAAILLVIGQHAGGIPFEDLRDRVEEFEDVSEIDFDAVVDELADEELIDRDEAAESWLLVEVSP